MAREQAGDEEVLARCCSLSVSDSLVELPKSIIDCLCGELFGVEVDNVLFFQAKLEQALLEVFTVLNCPRKVVYLCLQPLAVF